MPASFVCSDGRFGDFHAILHWFSVFCLLGSLVFGCVVSTYCFVDVGYVWLARVLRSDVLWSAFSLVGDLKVVASARQSSLVDNSREYSTCGLVVVVL